MITKNFQTPPNEEIANYAYTLWEAEGRMDGRDLDYWLQAEAHLTAALKHETDLRKPTSAPSPGIAEKISQPAPANAPAFSTKPSSRRQNRPARGRTFA